MPSIALTTFLPDDQTTVIMLDHDHRYLTAFDRPTAADVAHIIVADSRGNPISFLTFNCRACDLAADAGRPRTNVTIAPDLGPPPAYEVDRTLPDYHEQDQERTEIDRPRNRRRSLEPARVAARSPVRQERRSVSRLLVRPRFTGRQALERAIRRREEQAEIIDRDFQPLVPEAPPAAPVIARDFQPNAPTVQPVPVVRLPPSSPVRTFGVEEEQSAITGRDFQPLRPRVQPAASVIVRDFQPDDPAVQPVPVVNLPPSSPARTPRVQEDQSEITRRDFQPLTPEAPPATQVIARDFQPSDPTVEPGQELPTESHPPSTPVRIPRFSEVFDERHYEALARFTEEARENSGR